MSNDAPRQCRTCRYWDVHSLAMKMGDCRVPGDHRYSHVKMSDGSYALLDSFGPEETPPHFVCGAWDNGSSTQKDPTP